MIIRVPSENERIKMADDAIARHNALAPMHYNTRGIFKCCGVLPEYRNGGAVLGSFTCPKCKRHEGIWSCNFSIIFNNWNGNTYRSTWTKNPIPKENFLKSIDGYEDGWRYIPNISFNTCYNAFKGNGYYSADINHISLSDVIVRYNVNESEFEFYSPSNTQTLKTKYNPPKSGGAVGYGIEGDYIIDNDNEHKNASIHNHLSFSGANYKWSDKVMEIYNFLVKN